MALSSDLISRFVKETRDNKRTNEGVTVYGTIVENDGKKYVQLDGSDLLTPIETMSELNEHDRVIVMIKNHTATIMGNLSSPSASTKTTNEIGRLVAEKATIGQLDVEVARIDKLIADNAIIEGKLTANEAEISNVKADNLAVKEKLTAAEADIKKLDTEKLDAETADIKYATIKNLEATNADIYNLESVYGDFVILTTENFNAVNAVLDNLDSTYANIDFSNIGKAAMEYFYANSGLIKNVIVGDATISGELVGVTIKGDLIEANTVVADKLVIQGSDGLYYKLNTDGIKIESEQTDYNSLNGQIIRAKSVTAEKIAVEDLVAFGATIGGFKIGDTSIYSGVKETVDNTTRGIYMDNTGQIAFGDNNNFVKYYKDQNGDYKLEVSAKSIKFGINGTSVETAISEAQQKAESAIISSIEQFYQSDSPTSLSGGDWAIVEPVWIDGKYIWRRTKVTYGNGNIEYSPSETGVCITGNTGAQGERGENSVMLYIESSNGTVFKNNSISTVLSVVIYYGDKRITDESSMKSAFGNSAYLQWKWKLPEDDDYVSVALDDYRIGGNGFTFTITPEDVATRVTFICELII